MRVLLVAICLLTVAPSSGQAGWEPVGSGMDAPVYALTTYQGELIAGGEFMHAGDAIVNHIARWDGSSWQPLGPGLDGNGVYALQVYEGDLIAGGWFRSSGGVPLNHIARWDGTAWHPLDSGVGAYDSDYVQALTVFDGKLIAGGPFTQAGMESARYIAQWDGTAWGPVGTGMNNRVCALATYDGRLVAGGFFTQAGGQAAAHAAQWDGTAWSPLGAGTNNDVVGLGDHAGTLIACGYFTLAGGAPAAFIASWNGAAWSPLGSGANNAVNAVVSLNGELFAGGVFTQMGGVAARRIARWDGAAWYPLGSGLGGDPNGVASLSGQGQDLIVGGFFNEAGDEPADRIARWLYEPLGACCREDGTCVITTSAECIPPDTWMGAGVSCNPDPCEPTAVLLSSCRAQSSSEGLSFRWELSVGATGLFGRLWRDPNATPLDEAPTPEATLVSTAWSAPTMDGIIELVDPAPLRDLPCRYFLEVVAGSGPTAFLGPVEARWTPAASRWTVEPNPSSGVVRLAPPEPGPASAEIFDPAGRLVRVLERHGGNDPLEWDGRDGSGDASPSGLYLVRLGTASGDAVRRFVRIQ